MLNLSHITGETVKQTLNQLVQPTAYSTCSKSNPPLNHEAFEASPSVHTISFSFFHFCLSSCLEFCVQGTLV